MVRALGMVLRCGEMVSGIAAACASGWLAELCCLECVVAKLCTNMRWGGGAVA